MTSLYVALSPSGPIAFTKSPNSTATYLQRLRVGPSLAVLDDGLAIATCQHLLLTWLPLI